MEDFNDLYNRNFKIVYAFLLNLSHNPDTAEEITQQTFYIAFEKIMQIIYQLPEPYNEVFLLRTIAEMSHQEIGELLGKSENWSRVIYYRAKRKIIDCIGRLEDEM